MIKEVDSMSKRANLALINIEAAEVEKVTVNTVVTAAVVIEDSETGLVDIKVANRMVLGKLITKARQLCPSIKPAGFVVDKQGNVKGNGLIAIKPLLQGGEARCFAVAEIKRYGNNEVAGYVLVDRAGNIGKFTKATVAGMMTKNASFVANMKLVTDSAGRSYCALKDTNSALCFISGKAESQANLKAANKQAQAVAKKPVATKVDKEAEAKAKFLAKLKGTKFGSLVNDQYSVPCLELLFGLAKAHRRYEYLLNPKYSFRQMATLVEAYAKGVDISVLSDPKLSEDEMYDRMVSLQNGFWSESKFL